MMEVAAVASWHSMRSRAHGQRLSVCVCMCGVKAGMEAGVVVVVLLLRAVTWLLGRTWTGPWAGLVGGVEAEPAGPLSACWERAAELDV